MNQTETPILDGIREYHERQMISFRIPGHKGGAGADTDVVTLFGAAAFENDIPALMGIDDRAETNERQKRAERLASKAYGAKACFFSTNGSSLSVHAALLAIADPHDTVLVARTAHKSLAAALILAQVKAVFLEPSIDASWDLEHGLDPEYLDRMLTAHPEAKAVFVVNPDFYGVCSDIGALVKVCHSHGKPLIVDQAWGPHFAFHPELPTCAIAAGADVALGSIHKTLSGLGQASLFLLNGSRIDRARFEKAFELFETTSASSLILGSIDAARRQHALQGKEIWTRILQLSRDARKHLSDLSSMRVMGKEVLGQKGAFSLDETKIVLDMKPLGMSGFEAGDYLWREQRIAVELADYRHLMVVLTAGDDESSLKKLLSAMRELTRWASLRRKTTYVQLPTVKELRTEPVMDVYRAFYAKTETVKIEKSVNLIAAETITPYPPGVPRLMPGERITQPIVDYLKQGLEIGMFVTGACDPKLRTIRVVKT